MSWHAITPKLASGKGFRVYELALRQKGPDVVLLNEMGILYGELGDWGRQEKFYREAANVSNNATPLFNLALSKYHRGLYTEALVIIDEALELRSTDLISC